MTTVSDIGSHISNGMDFLSSADAILKKTLTSVPAGRPRRGAGGNNKRKQALSEGSDEDDLYISNILQELRVELDVKRREEERLQKEIADVLTECASGSAGDHQSRAFGMAVSRLNNAMLVVETDTKQLAASLRTISRLADNISGKVSALDVAKTRVVECLQLAGDMHDLDAGQNVSHSYEVLTNAAARLKEILEKKLETAVEAEDIPSMQSSVVDDVLFLVRKCVRRAMSSGSVDCVCAALNYGVALLETTYYQHLHNTIQAGYPSTNFAAEALQTAQNAYNVIQHGKTTDPDVQRDTFITAANNARGTAELLLDLRKGLENEWSYPTETVQIIKVYILSCDAFLDLPHTLTDVQLAEFEAVDPFIEQFNANLDKQIASFESVLHKENFQSLLLAVCSEVESQLERVIMKCSFNRLGGLQLDREFRQLSAYLSGVAGWTARERCARLSQLAEFEAVDPFIEQFNANLDKQIASFESVLHKENFQSLLLAVCSEVESQLERVIMKCSFNRLGGLQLDREFRQLSAYLSGVAGWTARERCARLSQIVALLNVENVDEAIELREATRTSPIARMLSANDTIKVLELRVDLPAAVIQKLEF
ncbi:hypothetical protein TELCIR_15040 [Teladorsagia circumcincta]|uniref:Conserved oligomeric Golgi complex subunit 4 n=1 Tax=Teladorsagia circumcincta TaxID=45464 RepID=A0A2G9TZ97_TELCI|nr:hypothetical protein TELCIR_15040 [Teladorsagia circumcincta]